MSRRNAVRGRRHYSNSSSFGLDALEPRMMLSDGPVMLGSPGGSDATNLLAAVSMARNAGGSSAAYIDTGGAYNVNITARASTPAPAVEGRRQRVDSTSGDGSEVASGRDDSGSGQGTGATPSPPAPDPTPAPNPAPAPDPAPPGGGMVYTPANTPTGPGSIFGPASPAGPTWPGVNPIADPNPALAGLGTMPDVYRLGSQDFYDIVGDNNGQVSSAGLDLAAGRDMPIVDLLSLDQALYAGGTAQSVAPTVGLMIAAQSAVTEGDSAILTASNVQSAAGTTVEKVSFYRESGGAEGLQTLADTYLGEGVLTAGVWTLTTSTAGLSPGEYLYYAVATDSKDVQGPESLAALTVLAPAPGDNASVMAQPLPGPSAPVKGGQGNAVQDAGKLNPAGNMGGRSVSYARAAMSGDKVTVDTAGSAYDTMVGVYTGNAVNAVSLAVGNDDARGDAALSQVLVGAVKGMTYRIAAEGYAGGNVQLKLNQAVIPANDRSAGAAPASGGQATGPDAIARAPGKAGERGQRAAPAAVAANTPRPPSR